jgi:hypothetical protein
MNPPILQRAVKPMTTNSIRTPAGVPAPPVHWPGQQSSVQNRQASLTPGSQRPFPGVAAQPRSTVPNKPFVAVERNTTPRPGARQMAVAQRAVIQRWECRECGREIRWSDDHRSNCRYYHHRTYETRADEDANYYDRRRGQTRTRSGSVERQYSDGTDVRYHYHENRYGGGGYVQRPLGEWDRRGNYTSYQ